MRITLCDNCGMRIMGGMIVTEEGEDFCSFECAKKEEPCTHEENMSDEAAGRSTARLICKQCGYDRIEEVA